MTAVRRGPKRRLGRVATYAARVGAVIARLRFDRGMLQDDLGAVVGITGATVSRIEAGRSGCNLDQLARIAAAFGVKPGEILREVDEARDPG